MAQVIKFPPDVRAVYTKDEGYFLFSAGKAYEHAQGRMLPVHCPLDEKDRTRYFNIARQGDMFHNLTGQQAVEWLWQEFPGMKGKPVEELYELRNRQTMNIARFLFKLYVPESTDELSLAFKGGGIKWSQSMDFSNEWAEVTTGNHSEDVPARISCKMHSIQMYWRNKEGKTHRNIDNGPASVEFNFDTNGMRMQISHWQDGERTTGHDKWQKKCAASNPWVTYLLQVK